MGTQAFGHTHTHTHTYRWCAGSHDGPLSFDHTRTSFISPHRVPCIGVSSAKGSKLSRVAFAIEWNTQAFAEKTLTPSPNPRNRPNNTYLKLREMKIWVLGNSSCHGAHTRLGCRIWRKTADTKFRFTTLCAEQLLFLCVVSAYEYTKCRSSKTFTRTPELIKCFLFLFLHLARQHTLPFWTWRMILHRGPQRASTEASRRAFMGTHALYSFICVLYGAHCANIP